MSTAMASEALAAAAAKMIYIPESSAALAVKQATQQIFAVLRPKWEQDIQRASTLAAAGIASRLQQLDLVGMTTRRQSIDTYGAMNSVHGLYQRMQTALAPPNRWSSIGPLQVPSLVDALRTDRFMFQKFQADSVLTMASIRADLLGISGMLDAIRRANESMLASMSASVTSLLDSVARYSGLGETIARTARRFRETLSTAIIGARDAALRGDIQAVARFFRRWTTLPRRGWHERVEAATLALLEADLTAVFDDPLGLLEEIQEKANREYTTDWVGIGDTTLKGRPVLYAEQLPQRAGAEGVAAEEFLPPARSTEDRALFRLNQIDDARLSILVGGLSPDEARVVHAYRLDRCASWQAAALACELPASDGERVRAKVQRHAKALTQIPSGPATPFWR